MVEMNPYYARESSVGPVFDVARFSPFKTLTMAVVAFCVAAAAGVAAVYVWNPEWIVGDDFRALAEANKEVVKWWRDSPTATLCGVGVAASLAALFAAFGSACLTNVVSGDYFLRAGEGGMSLRVPNGFGVLERDLPWSEIETYTVIQRKELGALSRNTGNLDAQLQIHTFAGEKLAFSLDCFREPAHLIYDRIQEAAEMRPADLVGAAE